jgi:hypothetical protein
MQVKPKQHVAEKERRRCHHHHRLNCKWRSQRRGTVEPVVGRNIGQRTKLPQLEQSRATMPSGRQGRLRYRAPSAACASSSAMPLFSVLHTGVTPPTVVLRCVHTAAAVRRGHPRPCRLLHLTSSLPRSSSSGPQAPASIHRRPAPYINGHWREGTKEDTGQKGAMLAYGHPYRRSIFRLLL